MLDKDDYVFVAVYGTLMHGEGNHSVLSRIKGAHCVFPNFHIGKASLYAVERGAPYPYLVLTNDDRDSVLSEMWRVPTEALPALDFFEGVPHLYDRVERTLLPNPWGIRKFFVYARLSPPDGTSYIPEGSWRAYRARDVGRYREAGDSAS